VQVAWCTSKADRVELCRGIEYELHAISVALLVPVNAAMARSGYAAAGANPDYVIIQLRLCNET
jgi:hypothetical protein